MEPPFLHDIRGDNLFLSCMRQYAEKIGEFEDWIALTELSLILFMAGSRQYKSG